MDEIENKIPALFLHIQKTAGTSIIAAARRKYGNDMTSHGDCWGRPPGAFSQIGFVSGHLGYNYAESLFDGRYSFTFLRNPIERVLSMYYFCRERDANEFMIYKRANEFSLEVFLRAGFQDEWVRKNIWNNQVWQLAHGYAHLDARTIVDFEPSELLNLAIEHLDCFSYVGFTEQFDIDATEIFKALNLPSDGRLPKANVTIGRPAADEVSRIELDLLEELTELDRKLYAYAWEKYQLKDLG